MTGVQTCALPILPTRAEVRAELERLELPELRELAREKGVAETAVRPLDAAAPDDAAAHGAAVALVGVVLAAEPGSARTRGQASHQRWLGYAYEHLGMQGSAIGAYEAALAGDITEPAAYRALARIYAEAGASNRSVGRYQHRWGRTAGMGRRHDYLQRHASRGERRDVHVRCWPAARRRCQPHVSRGRQLGRGRSAELLRLRGPAGRCGRHGFVQRCAGGGERRLVRV